MLDFAAPRTLRSIIASVNKHFSGALTAVRSRAVDGMRGARFIAAIALMAQGSWLSGCDGVREDVLPGTLERDRVELVADAAETILESRVREGQIVRPGDAIVVQDSALADSQFAGAAAQLAEAQARLDELTHGPRSTTIAAAAARRDRARAQRDDETRELERMRDLAARNLISRSALDRQSALAAAADASLREAEQGLRELLQGTRGEQVQQARLAVEAAVAQLAQLRTTRDRLIARAPVAAIVDALPYRVGEKPARGAVLAVLLASGAPFARIHIPEALRARVKAGTPARIRVDGSSQEFAGRVRYVASEAEFTPYYSLTESDRSRLSFVAEVLLDGEAAAQLPSGIPVEVRLQLEPNS